VQTVRIPMLSTGPKKKSAARRLFSLGRETPKSAAAPDGCDPKVFADEIAHYLTRSLEERTSAANSTAARTPALATKSPAQSVNQWSAPEALEELAPPVVENFRAPTAGDTGVADTHVPGSILDLRSPIVHTPAQRVIEHEPFLDVAGDKSFDITQDTLSDVAEDRSFDVAQGEPVVIEPEPEPLAIHAFVEPQPTFDVAQDELIDIEPEQPASMAEPSLFIKPEPPTIAEPHISTLIEPIEIIKPNPATVAATPPRPATGASPSATTSGTSPSFEAALAAIRAAWEKPEPKAPASAEPAKTSNVAKPISGLGEVDLTNDIDALESVAGAGPAGGDADSPDESRPVPAHRKAEQSSKRPDRPRARKTSGPDGRDDWSVLDPNQCEFSALVNKLDEVTDSDEPTTPRATNRR
jgi:hypothetical protein